MSPYDVPVALAVGLLGLLVSAWLVYREERRNRG